jgi:subtilase family serine protease
VVALPPNTSTNLAIAIPEDCIYGCRLTVTVDERDLVRESDENNNQWTYLIDPIPGQSARRGQVR